MKSTGKVLMMSLFLLSLSVCTLNAQRPDRGMRMDSTRMNRRMGDPGRMPLLMNMTDSVPMRGMRHGMERGMMMQGGRGWMETCPMMHRMPGRMGPGPMMGGMRGGMWGGMRPMPMDRMGQPGWGMRLLDNIPNLTDKQKKDIADLRQKQMDEMKKLRDEMSLKMKSLRDAQKAKVIELLTPEQKKWIEENTPKAPVSTEKVK